MNVISKVFSMWMIFCGSRVLENACKLDTELREIIGDSMGDAEEMQKRVLLQFPYSLTSR